MNQKELQELMMGAALVALGYAVYKHFKAPTTAPAARPAGTTAQAPSSLLSGLLNGTLTGLENNSTGYYNSMGNYQSTDDQIAAAAGVDTSGNDSIVKPGAWWYGL